jgi:hypothetical protein
MLASGSALLSALFLVAGTVELETGARLETRAGQAPTGIQLTADGTQVSAEETQLVLVATPILALRWMGDNNTLRADSATRFLWRPLPRMASRPLVLESIEAAHVARPSQRSRWQLDLRGSYGEEDYTSLAQQFANQPTLPVARIMLSASATGDGSWRASRRTTLTMQASAIHRRPFDTQPLATGVGATTFAAPALPTQTLVTFAPGVRHALTRRLSLEATAGIADVDIQGLLIANSQPERLNVFTVQPQVGAVQELSRSHRLRAVAGMTYAAVLVNPDKSRAWLPVTPLFRAELASVLLRTRKTTANSLISAGTTWFADPVLGAAVLRGIAEARIDALTAMRWGFGAHAAFATDLTGPLAPSVPGTPAPDETVVSFEIPVRYRMTNQLTAEFGARYAERAPHLAAANFAWHYRELWAFLTLSGTTRPSPRRAQNAPPP